MNRPRGAGGETDDFGSRLRAAREDRKIGVRELSRQIDVSASMISQIELGRVMPSVKTLYAMTSVLGMSLDDLFAPGGGDGVPPPAGEAATGQTSGSAPAAGDGAAGNNAAGRLYTPVQRAQTRKSLTLASGVIWELLTATPDPQVEFQESIYQVGGESAPAAALMRHGGHEYGLVTAGRLGVTVGFDTYELEPGDSISFESSIPHRLFNLADVVTTAIWVVVGRRGDHRTAPAG